MASAPKSGMVFDNRIDDVFLKLNQIWNIKQTAQYTGYAIGTLYNLVSQNLIPFKKKRGKLYFIPTEVQNWIEEGDM